MQLLLADEPAEDAVEVGFVPGQLDVYRHVGLGLLMEEPVVTMSLDMTQLGTEGLALHMLKFDTLFLQTREHHIVTVLNLLDFSLVGERDIKETVLWKEYLIYATLFGIADKVCDSFTKIYPDYFKMNQMAGTRLSIVGNRSLVRYSNAVVEGLEKPALKKS